MSLDYDADDMPQGFARRGSAKSTAHVETRRPSAAGHECTATARWRSICGSGRLQTERRDADGGTIDNGGRDDHRRPPRRVEAAP
jgi:hypothetical protein